MNDTLFHEKQGFNQWWLWVLLIGLNGIFLYGFIQQVILGIPFGDKPGSDAVLILSSTGILLMTLWFLTYRFETVIKKDGIYLRYPPFVKKSTFYSWSDIRSAEIRKYSPIKEYGGWGFRSGAINVSGNMGLQLKFNSGRSLLIGTNKPDELSVALMNVK